MVTGISHAEASLQVKDGRNRVACPDGIGRKHGKPVDNRAGKAGNVGISPEIPGKDPARRLFKGHILNATGPGKALYCPDSRINGNDGEKPAHLKQPSWQPRILILLALQ
jgi:hypothetical protein